MNGDAVEDSLTRRSALLFPVQATALLLLPTWVCSWPAYSAMVAEKAKEPGNLLFLSSSSSVVPATTDDARYADVFKLSGMPTRQAKTAVQLGGDQYSRVERRAAADPYDMIGAGVTLNQVERGGQIIVSAVRPGSPADDAGLRYGDAVVAVNGKPTKGRNVFGVVEQVCETMEAPTVTLTIVAAAAENNNKRQRDVVLRRDFSNVPDPVSYCGVTERRPNGTVVGCIRLSQFSSTAPLRVKQALSDLLKSQGANALVIDVRGNGGGALQSALWTVKLFLGGGDKIILNSVEGSNTLRPYRATNKSSVLVGPSVPIVVLVNRGSASATEIFASALRDNCRALVMGERSYGKGLIQATVGLADGSRLVVTAGRYLTPNGKEIQGRGIAPDIPGRGIIASSSKPGERLDTSKIDFRDVSARLSRCSPPKA